MWILIATLDMHIHWNNLSIILHGRKISKVLNSASFQLRELNNVGPGL
jgi:hypothetical protein